MNQKEKEEALKIRLTNLKDNLNLVNRSILSALENLNNFDDFTDLINNWDKYSESFKLNYKSFM